MPHSIFFTAAGHAIHGTNTVRRLGSPASHGCARLASANAAKLFDLVQSEGLDSTKIVVSGAEARGKAKDRLGTTRSHSPTDKLPLTALRRDLLPISHELVTT